MFPDSPTKDDYKQDCLDAIEAMEDFVMAPNKEFLNKLSKKQLSNLSIWLDDINARLRGVQKMTTQTFKTSAVDQ